MIYCALGFLLGNFLLEASLMRSRGMVRGKRRSDTITISYVILIRQPFSLPCT